MTVTAKEGMGTSNTSAVFSTVDLVVFLVMLVASLVIGVTSAYTSRKNTTTNEYLLGSRQMSPLPVGLSLLGGWVSAISILGELIGKRFI